jgi:tetratricopeptide (TPR) repeat protein
MSDYLPFDDDSFNGDFENEDELLKRLKYFQSIIEKGEEIIYIAEIEELIEECFDYDLPDYGLILCDAYLKHYPEDPDILNYKSIFLNNLGKFYEAYDISLKALSLNKNDAEVYINKGLIEENLQLNDLAKESYYKALELEPDNPEIYYNLGVVYMKENQNDEAAYFFEKALEIDSFYSEALANLFLLYKEEKNENKIKKLETTLENILKNDPDNYMLWNVKGLIENIKGNYLEAIACFELSESLSEDVIYLQASINKGYSYYLLGNYSKAIDVLNEATEYEPFNPFALFYLGLCFKEIGELDRSIQKFTEALDIYPEFVDAYVERAFCYEEMNNYKKAYSDCKEAIKLDPNNDELWALKGECELNLNKLQLAKSSFEKAIDINPKEEDYYYYIGIIYQELGDYKKSENFFDKCLELNPENALVYLAKAKNDLEQNNYAKAYINIETAFNLNPRLKIDFESISKIQFEFLKNNNIFRKIVDKNEPGKQLGE